MKGSAMAMLVVLAALLLAQSAYADVYLHSPRGSNNRLDEANRDRNNGNRLFDSQNNNRGGYNVGSVYYYQGSKAYFEWTVQHSCGNENTHCEMVLQYMCDDVMRDGTTTDDIPTNPEECNNYDCDTDVEYGRQESYDWYRNCRETKRNEGLYTANQNVKPYAASTRQNPNGNRNGYECPEERDYYPYWRPTPWKDIAILTNEPTRCADYVNKSQNVASKWHCVLPQNYTDMKRAEGATAFIPLTAEECEDITIIDTEVSPPRLETGVWTEVPAWGIPAPHCRQNQYSRDNHHGNIEGGFMMSYNWTVPSDFASESCVFRLRYNMSSYDFEHWNGSTSVLAGAVNASMNAELPAGTEDDPAWVPIWETYGMDYSEVNVSFDRDVNADTEALRASREYVLKNDPDVDMFGSLLPDANKGLLKLQMNINTAQFGRTFEDRSHLFGIRERPEDVPPETLIHNLQVRGKRGNIVQTYPAVEYDFQPNRLHVAKDDYVHIQWTGSNTNPNNNAGQGQAGSDRSNIVGLWSIRDAENITDAANGYGPSVYPEQGTQEDTTPMTFGQFGTSFPNNVLKIDFLGLDLATKTRLAVLDQYGGELSELDDAGTYFDLGPRKVSTPGTFHYLSTRNNNFSNRSQKGKIVVLDGAHIESAVIGWEGGIFALTDGSAAIEVPEGTFGQAVHFTLSAQEPSEELKAEGVSSDLIHVDPKDLERYFLEEDGYVTLSFEFDSSFTFSGYTVYTVPHGDAENIDDWESVGSAKIESDRAYVNINSGGVFFVQSTPLDLVYAVLAPVAGVIMILFCVGLFRYQQEKSHYKEVQSGRV